ncbi:alpha-1,3-mannosyl-glycoprotein 4-beta-N-acetylglucosaminyltransferase-like protein MGAT4D [Sceloporus undulatus]|uniref:alpha-1,3-mannosyl-glycoprotein 4-beta-N-acetylglucosaminyltransferase-like protein MGAT4D n=1 Tax=Sceloporus undulatus TaxID=8520 RepID=UPI001C4D1397|nr:alpha-1,3-mannosyl-glycoprotein 4-beta-N-acetylglucosaminyltransferase-like protein MGAT4D [Sceloporus undulatus]
MRQAILRTNTDLYERQILELRQRLLYAEKENKKRSHVLNDILTDIKQVIGELTKSSVNVTGLSSVKWKAFNLTNKLPLHLTNIRYYLPHLQEHEDRINPNIIIGQGRAGVSLVMGIPTVRRRKHNYLMNTLNSLFYEMSEEQKNNCVVVVFVAEVDSEYINSTAESIRKNFPNEVLSGILEVIAPPAFYYPEFSNLKETFGDSKERVRWRTKQNLDYSFLMLYAQPKGRFYLQLEDDIIAGPEYIQIINDFAKQQESQEWMILEFSQLGFIGKLFRCRDLPLIVDFFLMFYKDKPIDWLLDHLLGVKVCNPEKDARHCERQKDSLRIRYKPSLFQHVGLHSSLAGKIQYLKDKDFFRNSLFKAHANPPAKVSTSLKAFKHFTLEKAYRGVECFWAFAPVAGDYILFSFQQPLELKSYLFRSGNLEYPGDKLLNTTVDVLPDGETDLQSAEGKLQDLQHVKTSDGYFQIGTFENGKADGIISPALGRIQALRLSIHSSSSTWVLLSEIFLKT